MQTEDSQHGTVNRYFSFLRDQSLQIAQPSLPTTASQQTSANTTYSSTGVTGSTSNLQSMPATNSNVDTTVGLAKKYIQTKGPKTGDSFVLALEPYASKLTENELFTLFEMCKKLPLRQSDFDKVYKDVMDKAATRNSTVGITKKTAPQRAMETNAPLMKKILQDRFWSFSIKENILNWSALLQTSKFKAFMTELLSISNRCRLPAPNVVYSNAYWSFQSFNRAIAEMSARIQILVKVVLSFPASSIDLDKLVAVTTKLVVVQPVDTNLCNAVLLTKKDNQIKIADEIARMNAFTALACVVIPDVRKLMQTKEFKLERRQQSQETHIGRLKDIAWLMSIYIILGEALGMPVKSDYVVKMGVNEEFARAYFNARNIIAAHIRQLKNTYFGGTNTRENQANTRFMDDEIQIESINFASEVDKFNKQFSALRSEMTERGNASPQTSAKNEDVLV